MNPRLHPPGAPGVTPRVVRLRDAAAQPWRNGGGVTRELLAWPQAQDWQLRVSVADIEADGPFSAYPGVERWFAVLEGAGVALQFARTRAVLARDSAPLRFDGSQAPAAALLAGPTRDLNLMLRGLCGSMTAIAPAEACAPHGSPCPAQGPGVRLCAVFTAVPGRLEWRAATGDPATCELAAFELAWFEGPAGGVSFHAQAPARRPDAAADDAPFAGWWIVGHDPGDLG